MNSFTSVKAFYEVTSAIKELPGVTASLSEVRKAVANNEGFETVPMYVKSFEEQVVGQSIVDLFTALESQFSGVEHFYSMQMKDESSYEIALIYKKPVNQAEFFGSTQLSTSLSGFFLESEEEALNVVRWMNYQINIFTKDELCSRFEKVHQNDIYCSGVVLSA